MFVAILQTERLKHKAITPPKFSRLMNAELGFKRGRRSCSVCGFEGYAKPPLCSGEVETEFGQRSALGATEHDRGSGLEIGRRMLRVQK